MYSSQAYSFELTDKFTASTHSLPSPNGVYIATITGTKVVLRLTRSLETLRTTTIPESLSTSVKWFFWSSTSDKLLIANADFIRIISTSSPKFSATIANPTSETAKITHIAFGANDDEVVVFADFGLKATIFNLRMSTSIDLNAPKFFLPGNAGKGYSYRTNTAHCAVLSRNAGKDVISIHKAHTYDVVRSWNPDTIDAQSLSWSPDGRWLAIVESSGQGHKIIFYTPDGHPYKVWRGNTSAKEQDNDLNMGAGVRLLEWSTDGNLLAIGDHTSRITLLSSPVFSNSLSLNHISTINPTTTLKVWQEQIVPTPTGFERTYTLASQITAPPTTEASPSGSDNAAKIGTNILSMDASGTLVASRAENMPTAIWIWDTATKVLKTVLIQHAPVARLSWHQNINELLMIRCEGEESRGLVHIWEPTWETPKVIDFSTRVPEGKLLGKTVARWLTTPNQVPALFFSDSQDAILAALSDDLELEVPWQDEQPHALNIYGEREESPLNLVPIGQKVPTQNAIKLTADDQGGLWGMDDVNEVDDTFNFRRHG